MALNSPVENASLKVVKGMTDEAVKGVWRPIKKFMGSVDSRIVLRLNPEDVRSVKGITDFRMEDV